MTHAWFSWVRSKDIEIMKVLEEQSSNLVKATSVLVELFSNYNSLKNSNSILKDLEHTGDNLTHKLFTIIDKTFVTPIDKKTFQNSLARLIKCLMRHTALPIS